MRDAFWKTYNLIAFKASYYKVYQGYAEKRLFWSRAICACVSIVSVLVWSISQSLPALWASLIALAQLAQTLIGFLPWSQQAAALRYLVPELDALLVDMYDDWLKLGYAKKDDGQALSECSVKYQRRFFELANRYTADVWFPIRDKIAEEAESDCGGYFDMLFPKMEGVDNNELKQPIPQEETEEGSCAPYDTWQKSREGEGSPT